MTLSPFCVGFGGIWRDIGFVAVRLTKSAHQIIDTAGRGAWKFGAWLPLRSVFRGCMKITNNTELANSNKAWSAHTLALVTRKEIKSRRKHDAGRGSSFTNADDRDRSRHSSTRAVRLGGPHAAPCHAWLLDRADSLVRLR